MGKDRLFQILYQLLEHNGITAGELAVMLEVSTRTIYRDVDALSSAGIPIYTERGKGGGIRLLGNFVLDKSLLTAREQDEILFALQSLQATNATENSQVISRLSGLFHREAVDWIDADFSNWGGGADARAVFQQLKTAILDRCLLRFRYFSGSGTESRRLVEPLKLRFKSGSWYLQAFCRTREQERLFKVARMGEVCVTQEHFPFRREVAAALEPTLNDARHCIQLELWIAPGAAHRVYDSFSREDVICNEDGSFFVTVAYPEDRWLMGFLLSFGSELRVLSPTHVRDRLRSMAEAIMKLYP